eukprot:scaffold7538_cov248-Pinguiococcus_pyrenoidosus.AAC.1
MRWATQGLLGPQEMWRQHSWPCAGSGAEVRSEDGSLHLRGQMRRRRIRGAAPTSRDVCQGLTASHETAPLQNSSVADLWL